MRDEDYGSLRWHRARIVFECVPNRSPHVVSRRNVCIMVYGDTEFAAMDALRKLYPRDTDFNILSLELAPR